MNPLKDLRTWLRQRPLWVALQETKREGWRQAWRRSRYQRLILGTPPVRTASSGPVEVRVLTWRRDWLNLLWAVKSFYQHTGPDFPLYIHDGGLSPRQAALLQDHFPDAHLVPESEANEGVEAELRRRNLARSLAYRRRNVSTRKVFDFFCLTRAEAVISIDSDILFFRRPDELLVQADGPRMNYYNKDSSYWYSMSLDELENSFGIRPPPFVNSGLSVVWRESVDFDAVEQWLGHAKLFGETWVTEQTLHALFSTVFGFEFLPDTYRVSTSPGLDAGLVCKHYPGYFRPLLYEEGMAHLVRCGFLESLRKGPARVTSLGRGVEVAN